METIITVSFTIVIAVAIIGVVALTVDIFRVEAHKDDEHLHLP